MRLSNRSSAARAPMLGARPRARAARRRPRRDRPRPRGIFRSACGSRAGSVLRGAERRLLQKALGDLADRAAADRADAGDRQQVGDQRVRGLRDRSRPSAASTPWYSGARWRRSSVSTSRSCASEVLRLKSFTSRRFHAGARSSAATSAANSADVAHANFGAAHAVVRDGLEAERQHLGVGRRLVGTAEGFDAGLQELRRGTPRSRKTGPR